MDKKIILTTGGAGFIGRRLAALLDPAKYAVRALSRDPAKARALLPASVEIVGGDMTDAASLRAALKGADAVIHLAAQKNDAPDVEAVNVGGARNLIAACKAAGVRRVVAVGTQASRLAVVGEYGRTKAEADALFRASGLDVTLILPSLVYGPGDPGVFGKLARWVSALPVVPVLGAAAYRPVHVDDLCRAIAGCLDEPKTSGREYAVGGPESVTLEGLIDLVAKARGKSPLKVRLPAALSMLLTAVTPLSRGNVLGATQSAPDADWGALFDELGLKPRSIERAMKDGHFL